MLCLFGGNLGLFCWEEAGQRVVLGVKCPIYIDYQSESECSLYEFKESLG